VPATATAPGDGDALDRAIEALDQADWLVVTSVRTVAALRAREAWHRVWPSAKSRVAVAAVGPATASALLGAGIGVALRATQGGAGDLIGALAASARGVSGRHLIWPRSGIADPGWIAAVERAGGRVTAPVAYSTVDVPIADLQPLVAAFDDGSVDAVTFCSPSSASSLARAFGDGTLRAMSGHVLVAALGPTTAEALRRLGAAPDVVASTPEVETLAAEVARHLAVARGGGR
jgi:uroporphyrinogen-III synthase